MLVHKKIRVAIVSQSMNIGGGEMIAAQLAGFIDSSLFDIKFFVIGKEQDNQIKDFLVKHNVHYECLNLPTSFNFSSYKIFSKALKKFSPDVVHEHLDVSYSWIWTLMHRIPLVATIHTDPFRRKNWKVDFLVKLRETIGKLKVVGCSNKTKELSIKCYGLKRDNVTYVYNPIDTSQFNVKKDDDLTIHFIHIGRFNEVKNHELLINAFNILLRCNPNCDLTLAGDGTLFEKIKDQVKELGIEDKVNFLGNVIDVPKLLENMSVFVLPSKTEAFPVSILEAMASGLPIIASNVGGIPEMVTDNGILVKPNDIEELLNAMKTLSDDEFVRKRMSDASINNIKRFDKGVIAREYESIYSAIAKGKSDESKPES